MAEHGAGIDGASLKAMGYLDLVIREILRLHPIVGGAFRRATKDFDLGGYRIRKARPCTGTCAWQRSPTEAALQLERHTRLLAHPATEHCGHSSHHSMLNSSSSGLCCFQ